MQQPAQMYFPTLCAEPQQERAMKAERGVTFGREGVQRSRNEGKKGAFLLMSGRVFNHILLLPLITEELQRLETVLIQAPNKQTQKFLK